MGVGPTRWVVLDRQPICDARVFRVVRLRSIRAPSADDTRVGIDSMAWGLDGTSESVDFFAIESADFVNVIALTDDDAVVLVAQHRHASGEVTLEIPGGLVDAGEDPIAAGLRELREETGFVGEDAVILGTSRPNPAIQTNRLTTVLVRKARLVAPPTPDEHEDCAVVVVPWAELLAMIDDGRVNHALVLAAVTYELRRRAVAG